MSVQCRTMPSQRPCKNAECVRPDCNSGRTVPIPLRFIDVVTDRGVPFRVTFGKREYRDGTYSPYEVVSFYDFRYAGKDFGPNGQFVSDYNPETLLERQGGYGLCLNGDYADWTIDGTTMFLIRVWLVNVTQTQLPDSGWL